MKSPSEILLSGEASALGQFFDKERAHLRQFLQRRINRKLVSRLDASDIIQDVFLRAQRALPGYIADPVIPPLIWLRHLSLQVLSEVHRKHFRGIRNPYREQDQISEFLVISLASSTVSVSRELDMADLYSKIRVKLTELNQIDREVLEMRHVDCHSLAEIAQMLNLTPDATKKRYYRALQRFKDLIDPQVECE